jgi:hypothetical protein
MTHAPLLGATHVRTLNLLEGLWLELCRTRRTQVAVLVGEPGFGKTRIVQELYRRLAEGQDGIPPYWPDTITSPDESLTLTAALRNTRKAVRPDAFSSPAEAEPSYLWLGVVLPDADGPFIDTSIDEVAIQISGHLAAALRARALRKQLGEVGKAALGFVSVPFGLDIAMNTAALAAEIRKLFSRRSDGVQISRNTGYEERLAAFSRTVQLIWGRDGRSGVPTVLVIEDGHVAQAPTVELIHLLASRNLPFLVIVCAQRQGLFENELARALIEHPSANTSVLGVPALRTADMVELARQAMPRAADDLLESLAENLDGNPYHLQLQIAGLERHIAHGDLNLSNDDLAGLPSRLDGLLDRLWDQLTGEQRIALAALSVVGHRAVPAIDAAALQRLGSVPYHEAEGSGWIRRRLLTRQFLELARWQLAHRRATAVLSRSERADIVVAALATSVELLTQADLEPMTRSLVRACLPHLVRDALGLGATFDRLAIAEELLEASTELKWDRRHADALATLDIVHELLVGEAPSGRRTRVVLHALHECCTNTRSHFGRGSDPAIDRAREYVELAERYAADDPQALVRALLQLSRAHRVPVGGSSGRQASRDALERARSVANQIDAIDDVTRNDLLRASYPWLWADGDPRAAADAAARAAVLDAQLYGDDHPRVIECLSDRAYYLRRADEAAGVRAYREVLAMQLRRWVDDRHPKVAGAKKNLAVGLVSLGDETSVREAVALATEAHLALERSLGSRDFRTAIALSARARAMVAVSDYCELPERTALRTEAIAYATAAYALGQLARPEYPLWPMRETLAETKAANGDDAGIAEMTTILEHRLAGRLGSPDSRETIWTAQRLARAFRRLDCEEEARLVEARLGLGPAGSRNDEWT